MHDLRIPADMAKPRPPRWITGSPLVRDMLHFTIRSAVQMVAWDAAGFFLRQVEIDDTIELPGGVIMVDLTLFFENGSMTEWRVTIPASDRGLDEVSVRPKVNGVEDEEIHWTELGRHMVAFECSCQEAR